MGHLPLGFVLVWSIGFSNNSLVLSSSHLLPALKSMGKGDFIGIFQVAAHR